MIEQDLRKVLVLAGIFCVVAAVSAAEDDGDDKQGILRLPDDVTNPLWVPERQRLQQEPNGLISGTRLAVKRVPYESMVLTFL